MLSVIIPTLNAARTLEKTILSLNEGSELVSEIIISDGGSTDQTVTLAKEFNARLITGARGRGPQLQVGAKAATGNWLLFLHADTRLSAGWSETVKAFMKVPENAFRAGVFRFRLDDDVPAARRMERFVNWRTKKLGLPYGDQALLIKRDLYTDVGGYHPMPLMEDVDIIRRVGRQRLVCLEADAETSAAKFRVGGYILRPLRNLMCLGLYFMGVPVRLIARIYR